MIFDNTANPLEIGQYAVVSNKPVIKLAVIFNGKKKQEK
jgi:hypothetical protein